MAVMARLLMGIIVFFSLAVAQAYHGIDTTPVFSAAVPTPFAMTHCNDRLYVYSHEPKKVFALDLKDGHLIAKYPIEGVEKLRQVSAIACRESKLLLAFDRQSKPNTSELGLFELRGEKSLVLSQKITLPYSGRVTDLVCHNISCYVAIKGHLYETQNLASWKTLGIPNSPTVPHMLSRKSENPFDDWQEELVLSDGQYTRIRSLGDAGLAVLDPYRASLTLWKNGKSQKFAGWGVWEGKMLSPKAFVALTSSYFIVSDIGLKALFAFDFEGRYLGTLTEEDKLLNPDYALAMDANGDVIFYGDYKKNKIYAVKLTKKAIPVPEARGKMLEGIRSNMFRREEVLKSRHDNRCLICHDGTQTDGLDRLVHSKANHPVFINFKGDTDLYLDPDRHITCASCHDPHHGAGTTEPPKDQKVAPKPFLRKEFRSLCMSCHKSQATTGANHPDKDGTLCGKCHMVHGGAPKLLTQEKEPLCISCHKKNAGEHRRIEVVMDTERAKGLHFEDGKMFCLTCHSVHLSSPEEKLLRIKDTVMPFCSSCHGDKTETLYQKYHSRIKKGAR